MKLISSLFGIYLMLTLISCGNDEAEENEANLLGTWQSTDVALRDCEDESDIRTETVVCPGEDCIRYTFSVDSTKTRRFIKKMVLPIGSQFETGTFSVGETKIDFCVVIEGEQQCKTSKFTVNRNILVLLSEDADVQCTREIKFIKEEEPESN